MMLAAHHPSTINGNGLGLICNEPSAGTEAGVSASRRVPGNNIEARTSQREPFRNKFVMTCKPELRSISKCGERVGEVGELANQGRHGHQAPRPTSVEVMLVEAHEASSPPVGPQQPQQPQQPRQGSAQCPACPACPGRTYVAGCPENWKRKVFCAVLCAACDAESGARQAGARCQWWMMCMMMARWFQSDGQHRLISSAPLTCRS